MDVGFLEIPAELAALLQLAEEQSPAIENQIAEVAPPQVKAVINVSLPADVNNFPFSKFINQHFQVPQLQVLNHPLQQPFTHLQGAERHTAVELFKLILRFLQAELLQGRNEIILGNFIAQKGISNLTLRNEIFCQVVNQMWKNPDMEEWQRACLLMATCLSCLRPSPELEKPLLKYVSDHAMEEYRALCQHKTLGAMQQSQGRAFPPTQLEWTANRRRGQMVLDIHLLNEDKVATEVESWTTGEELANWILKFRGQEDEQRGWTVSLHTGEEWRDMLGCDFVMDLISETEELGFFPTQLSTSFIQPGVIGNSYESHPGFDDCSLSLPEECGGSIPPAPNIQAPPLPPGFVSRDMFQADLHLNRGSPTKPESSRCSFENYVDNLFDPVFSHGGGEMERSRDLNRRMKGGGGIGPSQAGAYMTTGMTMVPNYAMGAPAMPQIPAVPAYQTMPLMPTMQPTMPLMATMQQIPAMQSVPMMQPMAPSMPAIMMPQNSVPQMASMQQYPRSHFSQPECQIDSSQLAAQQQTFINQQALLLAQQMTIQAMTISQQQQQEQQKKRQQEPQPVSIPSKATTPPKFSTKPILPAPSQQPNKASVKKELLVNKEVPKRKEAPPQEMDVPAVNNDIAEESILDQVESFQQKRNFFQKLGKEENLPVIPPLKILLPQPEKLEEKQETKESCNSEVEGNKETPPPENPIKETQHKEEEKEKTQSTGDKTQKLEMVRSSQGPTQPEPSQNIREIIKLYQNQPKLPPSLYQPVRRSAKPFLKRNDPKDEALSLLGMRGPASPTEVKDGFPFAAKVPPKPAPKPQNRPLPSRGSIQDQLSQIFSSPASGLPLPAPPPPPPFDPPSPSTSTIESLHSALSQKREAVFLQDENINTHLYRRTASVYFSYINIPWKLYLRKELFYPRERFNTGYILNLMCEQIIRDTYSDSCVRISKEERSKMRDLLAELHVGTDAQLVKDIGLKKRIVVAARDNWSVYFSRLFSVTGDIGSNVDVLSVSHRGIKLLKSVKAVGMNLEYYKVLQSYSYVEILSVTLQEETMLELALKNEQLVLYSVKAKQAKALITLFLEELQKVSNHIMAMKSYITDDKSLLNFRKGDIIKLLPMDGLEPGWQFGSIGGRSGLFPRDHVQPTAAPEYYNTNMGKNKERQKNMPNSRRSSMSKSVSSSEVSEKTTITAPAEFSINPPSSIHSSPEFGQYIMTEFALKYFREPLTMLGWKGMNAEGKNSNHLVQHTKVPIQESLIDIVDKQLNELAAKNFMVLMKFMGDQPPQKQQSDIDCLQSILWLCKEKEMLHDEICCQIIKQITDNHRKESCIRGWRTLYLFLGYYPCTSNLRPFVQRYLADVGFNAKHDFQAIAKVCQDNIHRTLQFGGRRHTPSKLELEAVMKGRNSRRILVYLPGKLERPSKIRPFSVGNDVLMEICADIGINDSEEAKEFSLFADKDNGEVVRPIRWNEYIFDFLLDDSSISLHFRRITWKEPLHFYNDLYVDVHYNQVLPIYLKGQLLLPNSVREAEQQAAILAAYQHKIRGAGPVPNGQQLKAYLPKTTTIKLNLEAVLKQTIQELYTMHTLSPVEAKIHFLSTVTSMPLFGYNVFVAKKTSEHQIPTPCLIAVDQENLIILNEKTTNEHLRISLKIIQTMRSLHPSDGSRFPQMEINYGSSVNPQTISFELKEAKELCHMIAMILDEHSLQSFL